MLSSHSLLSPVRSTRVPRLLLFLRNLPNLPRTTIPLPSPFVSSSTSHRHVTTTFRDKPVFLTYHPLPPFVTLQKDTSLLTTERVTVQGPQAIIEKLQSLPRMAHKVTSVQFQPTPQNSILILVSGDIKLEGQTNELKFSEVFQLLSDASNNFYIQNNIFALNYG